MVRRPGRLGQRGRRGISPKGEPGAGEKGKGQGKGQARASGPGGGASFFSKLGTLPEEERTKLRDPRSARPTARPS